MAITATTLSGAVSATDTNLAVASATGITAPVTTTGSGFTYLLVDQEMLFVESVSGTQVKVLRGQLGTQQVAHLTASTVLAGAPSDFPNFTPAQGASTQSQPSRYEGSGAIVATAATITPSGSFFHTTGTTAVVTINAPSADFVEGEITIVFDGSSAGLTWTAAGNIAVAGTATTAASMVTFRYDPVSAKWHPSRLA